MISGLEYESSPGGQSVQNGTAPKASNDTYQNQQLHHRRSHGTTNGHINGESNDLSSGDDDKYTKRTRAVRKLDFFPKMEVDYTVTTERGGQLTAVGYVLMAMLIIAEYLTWRGMNSERLEHIVVDKSLGKRMKVNLNITFPALHCDDLHLNIIDVAGDSQLEVSDKMFKQRLNLDGTPRPHAKTSAEANIKAIQDKRKQDLLKSELPDDYCGPCYGAQENDHDCCNTCDDIIERYRKKRWNENAVQPLAEQCIREGRGSSNEPKRMTLGEGCNLSGHFAVNRVAGNFHIAMGEGVQRDGRHIHQFLPEDRVNFIANHVVHELNFMDDMYGNEVREGVTMGKVGINGERSMDGVSKEVTSEYGTGLFQYFIKVVPTTYKGDDLIDEMGVQLPKGQDEKVLETNRYFYTERFRPLLGEVHEEAVLAGDPEKGTVGAHVSGKMGGTLHEKAEHHDSANAILPGVFFVYEIYPFAVEVTKNSVPLMHLLIRIMATVGGLFTIMSWIDGALYSREKKGRR